MITQLKQTCPTCGKVAKEKSSFESRDKDGVVRKYILLECFHIIKREANSQSPFEQFVDFAHLNNGCKHTWDKNHCITCDAYRLFDFQVEGARFLEKSNGHGAIFDEMGLGKTIQSLAYLNFHPEAFPVLFIVKSGIKFQWYKAIVNWLGPQFLAQVINSSKEKPYPGLKCYIISYDILVGKTKKRKDGTTSTSGLDYKLFEPIGIKTIILDECQQIKNPDSSRTQQVRMLARIESVEHIIPLSGTPWKNRGSEFFTVLNLLSPIKFNSYQRFRNDWVDEFWDGNKFKEGGIRNIPKFKEFTKDIVIRRMRAEVMPELPLINRTKLLVEMPDHAKKAYERERENLIGIMNTAILDGEEDSFEVQTKAMQSLIQMRRIVGIAKIPATVEFTQDFLEETDRKLVIFVHHKMCGSLIFDQLSEWCASEHLPKPLKLTADLDSSTRDEVCTQFNGNGTRLMVASTLASGEGLNLQSCSDCIMHERQWNPANEEQAEGRFIRIGQLAESVNATYVHGDQTVDTILDKLVEQKRINFHNSMNEGELIKWNESSLVKDLIHSIMYNK